MDIRFPKPSMGENIPENYIETEKQLKVMNWEKEKVLEDMRREESLLVAAKNKFRKKQEEFVKFLTQSSSYATQVMPQTFLAICEFLFGYGIAAYLGIDQVNGIEMSSITWC